MRRHEWPRVDDRMQAHIAHEGNKRKAGPRGGVSGQENQLPASAPDAVNCRERPWQHHGGSHHLPDTEQRKASGDDLTAVKDRVVVQDMGGAAGFEPISGNPS